VKFKVGFTDGALIDMRNAHSWYEEKMPGLGVRFADAVQRQSQSLESMPEKYRVVQNDIHVALYQNSHMSFTTKLKSYKLLF